MDLVTLHELIDSASVLLNNGDGSFAAATSYQVGDAPNGLTTADLDADGDLDLVTANTGSGDVSLLLNNGFGVFTQELTYAAGQNTAGVTTGDLDGDGYLDLVTASVFDNILVFFNQFGEPGCGHSAGTVTCTVGSLTSGASTTVTITVKVHSTTAGTITNTASVTATVADPNTSHPTFPRSAAWVRRNPVRVLPI